MALWERRSHKARPRPAAFTLIELLVVIAIIALLLSILMPSLRKAKQAAMVMQCSTHARQIAVGVLLYAQVSDDYLPIDNEYYGPTWDQRIAAVNHMAINGGLTSDTLWTCPLTEREPPGRPYPGYGRWYNHYGFNSNYATLVAPPGTDESKFFWNLPAHRVSEVCNDIVLISDFAPCPTGDGSLIYVSFINGKWPGVTYGGDWGNFAPWPVNPKTGKLDGDLHANRIGAAYVDGHAEALTSFAPSMFDP